MYVVTLFVDDRLALTMATNDRIRAADILDSHFKRLREYSHGNPTARLKAELRTVGEPAGGLPKTTCRLRTQAGCVVRTSLMDGVAGAIVQVEA
jgi:ribulose kinase